MMIDRCRNSFRVFIRRYSVWVGALWTAAIVGVDGSTSLFVAVSRFLPSPWDKLLQAFLIAIAFSTVVKAFKKPQPKLKEVAHER